MNDGKLFIYKYYKHALIVYLRRGDYKTASAYRWRWHGRRPQTEHALKTVPEMGQFQERLPGDQVDCPTNNPQLMLINKLQILVK